jgi:hypothetical protein
MDQTVAESDGMTTDLHHAVPSDRLRQAVTLAVYLVTVTVNAAANALPINRPTAEISDQFHVYVIPAGYVFGIWGLIYIGLGAFSVFQAIHGDDPVVRRIGWLPALSGVLNISWLLLFQYELFVLTVPLMVGLLLILIAIHSRLWESRDLLTRTTDWFVRIPFSIYLGWITVATIANVAQTLDALGFDAFGMQPQLVAVGVLLLGLAIASRFVWLFGDLAYGAVIVWAYIGIAVKEAEEPYVPIVALAGAVVMAALLVATIAWRTPRMSRVRSSS